MTLEQKKEYRRKYYQEHKEEMKETNKKWRLENKERYYELVYKSRKKKAMKLASEGIKYYWHSPKEREIINEYGYQELVGRFKKKEISNNNEQQ